MDLFLVIIHIKLYIILYLLHGNAFHKELADRTVELPVSYNGINHVLLL